MGKVRNTDKYIFQGSNSRDHVFGRWRDGSGGKNIRFGDGVTDSSFRKHISKERIFGSLQIHQTVSYCPSFDVFFGSDLNSFLPINQLQ